MGGKIYQGNKLKDFFLGFFGFPLLEFIFFLIPFFVDTNKIISNLMIILGVILIIFFIIYFLIKGKRYIVYGGMVGSLSAFIIFILIIIFLFSSGGWIS